MKNLLRTALMVLIASGTLSATAQVPQLSSYPSASSVIFLDFDGHYVSGSTWNGGVPFNCASSGLTNTQISEVFDRVAEDYRPFNINITTDSTKFDAAPLNKRMRVIITTTYSWYGAVGGVAMLNSFSTPDDNPCFVFTPNLSYGTKSVAEAASHEAGHTLGLYHQSTYDASCVKLSDYNYGLGAGEIGWAPIMGVGYYKNFTVWHNGANSLGCSNYQTDLSVITNATNGFGYRTDDYTNTYATAADASFDTSQQFIISGVVEKTDDKDLFKFNVPVFSAFTLNAVPYNVGTGSSGSDLDLQVEFLDGSYTTLGTYNPGTLLSSVIDTFINAGTYYLRIDGKGNAYAPEYGSLGSYSLQGSYVDASSLPVHKLELKGQISGDNHELSWIVEADETIVKQVMQYSVDGRNFLPLAEPANTARLYNYRPTDNRPVQYRLFVTFDNHKEYYSNVITIRSGTVSKPQLIGNFITGTSVSVKSPGNYDYRVIDQSGRTFSKGKINKGFSTINTGNISSGMYFVIFTNENEQWTEKIVKN